MRQFYFFAIGKNHAALNSDLLPCMGFVEVFHRCFSGKETMSGGNIVGICSHGDHESICSIGKHLTVAAFVHMAVIVGPVYGHGALYGAHRGGCIWRLAQSGFVIVDQTARSAALLFQRPHHRNQVVIAQPL